MSRRFLAELAERAIRSFLQGFATAWVGSTAIPFGDWAALKITAFGAAMAGVSSVMSLWARRKGDPESASLLPALDGDDQRKPTPPIDCPPPTDLYGSLRAEPPTVGPTPPFPPTVAPGGLVGGSLPPFTVIDPDDDHLGH